MVHRWPAMSAVVLSLVATAAVAQGTPDMTGRWIGRTNTIVAGSGGHWPSSRGTWEQPGLFQKDAVLEIKGQWDSRFWGVITLSGNGESTSEPFIGIVHDGAITIADTDGYFLGRLNKTNDAFDFCYAHADGPTKSSVVACLEVRKER
jgi:hypothetical protein